MSEKIVKRFYLPNGFNNLYKYSSPPTYCINSPNFSAIAHNTSSLSSSVESAINGISSSRVR